MSEPDLVDRSLISVWRLVFLGEDFLGVGLLALVDLVARVGSVGFAFAIFGSFDQKQDHRDPATDQSPVSQASALLCQRRSTHAPFRPQVQLFLRCNLIEPIMLAAPLSLGD